MQLAHLQSPETALKRAWSMTGWSLFILALGMFLAPDLMAASSDLLSSSTSRDDQVFSDVDEVLTTLVKNIRKWGLFIIIGSFAVYGIMWAATGRPKHWMLAGAAVGALILGLAGPFAKYFSGMSSF